MVQQSEKIKLAFFTSHPSEYNGPLFKSLARHSKIDLTVYYGWDFGVKETHDLESGVNIKWDIPLLEGYRYKFLNNWAIKKTSSNFLGIINPGIIVELFRNRYDAIIVHGYTHLSDWFCFFGALITGTPLIFRGETLVRPNQSLWTKALKFMALKPLFKLTKACLSIGSKSGEFYKYYGVPADRIFLTPYSVDNDFFINQNSKYKPHQTELKKELNLPVDLPVVIFMGKLIHRKRPEDLLKAFSQLKNGLASLVFVGDGDLRSALTEYVQEFHIRNAVFTGFISQGMMPKYYALGDIFVLPSDGETWGLVVNEAMCSGLPVIVSDAVPSVYDIVKDGSNGFIYPCGDVERLKNSLELLVNDRGKINAMGKKSLELISKWNYGACVTGILRALESSVK
ncbi:MAG: glycosyltransferase family 4 protein [Patescibacteria group bacterium]